jgi:predicted DNA-binding helix-hairpin-helix protein
MKLSDKLEILADAAKYDASCASSGAPKRASDGNGGIGATTGMGICHSYTPDGRCVSLLKILLTNFCVYDCQYCVNRRTSNVPRARFSVDEVVKLTHDFYLRNYIDGLFLSSGIIQSSDYTMEQLVAVARTLREVHNFRGYIHLKTIPDADPALIAEAGRYADRLSGEHRAADPRQRDAPGAGKERPHHQAGDGRDPPQARRKGRGAEGAGLCAGRAEHADDRRRRRQRRPDHPEHGRDPVRQLQAQARVLLGLQPDPAKPRQRAAAPPPLLREHRLYQADFLLRGYGFTAGELMPDGRQPGARHRPQAGLGAGATASIFRWT